MKAKVKRPYIAKNGTLIEPGNILSNVDEDSKFIEGLLHHDFVEEIKEDLPKFGIIATSKLAKVEIADKNYTEGGKKFFTFDEALEVQKKMKDTGWRLPTRHEWVMIAEEFGQDKNGGLDGEAFMDKLKLKMNGTLWGNYGNYWSSSRATAPMAYYLLFDASGVYPSGGPGSRYAGFSLRLVRDVKG